MVSSYQNGTDAAYQYTYDANGSVVSVNFNGTDYYYVRNGQGDVVKLIDGNGTIVTEYTYDTWGKLVTCSGSLSATLGAQNPFRYRGYVYDNETGFYYLQSRYYDPAICRFISADVFLSTGQGVLGHNTFAYCGNNPITRMDSEGEYWHIVAGIAIGAVVGAVSNIVSGVISAESKGKKYEFNLPSFISFVVIGAAEGGLVAACPTAAVGISTVAGALMFPVGGASKCNNHHLTEFIGGYYEAFLKQSFVVIACIRYAGSRFCQHGMQL